MTLESNERQRLRARAQDLDVTLRVGKAGVNANLVEEARAQLEDHDLIKVRLLRSARAQADDRETMAQEIADRAEAELVEVRGNTCVLYRP